MSAIEPETDLPQTQAGAQPTRQTASESIQQTCSRSLPAAAVQGLLLFNRGEFFEAHEYLELAWRADETPGRELYRAILQIAVAYLQIERGNYIGAVKMFKRMRRWLAPFPDVCRGIDLAGLRADSQSVYDRLIFLGKDRIQEFNPSG